jgi:hypothetical protein
LGTPYPRFLTVLRDKYLAYAASQGKTSITSHFPLGKFSVFLTLCLAETIPCTIEEKDALQEVSFIYYQ